MESKPTARTSDGPRDIAVTRSSNVVTIRFDRPKVLNAFRASTRAQLAGTLADLLEDRDARVVILTGSGRAFSAGQDLNELEARLDAEEEEDAGRGLEELQELTRALLALPQVTIAALNGVAVGLGAELALACDLRLAASSASIGFPEARRAMFQTNGVMWLLPRIVGHARASELVLTGRIASAIDAERIGLVHAVHADSELDSAAAAVAAEITANAPASLALAKALLRDTWGLGLEAVMKRESEGMLACLGSQDLREGNQAFLEKRAPVYYGR
ncbi:enoyl-CoA hydratase-related protein [Nonomuraea sp. NPDC046570]|uniref:enoyl-CoA hydratase/isomerase family protein n=1 Tax=Nonomuraea sp. NPDC046570 TaxID=3155255 RepID=UPI0033D00BA8